MHHISLCGLLALSLAGCALFCTSFAVSLPFWASTDDVDSRLSDSDDDYSMFAAGIWGFCTDIITDEHNYVRANCTPYRNWLFGSPNVPYNITYSSVAMTIAPVGMCRHELGSSALSALQATLPLSPSQFRAFYDSSCGGWARFSLVINVFVLISAIFTVGVYSVIVVFWICPPSMHTQLFMSRIGLRLLVTVSMGSLLVLSAWSKQSPVHVPYGSAYFSALVATLLYFSATMGACKYHFYDIPRLNGVLNDDGETFPEAVNVVFIELGTPVQDKDVMPTVARVTTPVITHV
ncbi:hypothetical protein SPRG_08230 [Saprolegnia parasitica CBS 223.65]|uniref:Membrane-associated protein n=1 Tax=Saprolegnia parasitica (strain CBS 223.65) TaxID=695850 RepID=A0A067CHY6_SAPPC|nr:hypothetical protein SPRG_08230 [Saprolegnia parasitica CBS 223.65]KDO26427.1 hypothetical protein SPRG_08230 [Saprolegnia parasitica CBS 223.65]|eukprot:XP_012202864.1 hypothetical protein SPRG_08230 [Saprolegnia parasitica CBS 223.65]